MFEALVADALNKHLGKFVVLDAESVRTSVWAGKLELTDLQLRAEAFESLGLPLALVGGCVRLITLEIPWRSLGKEPVRVHIDSVFACVRLLAEPAADSDPVPFKRAALAADQLAREDAAAAGDAAASGSADDGPCTSRLVQKIVDNVQICLSNVHIRFEDPLSCPAMPFCECSHYHFRVDTRRHWALGGA